MKLAPVALVLVLAVVAGCSRTPDTSLARPYTLIKGRVLKPDNERSARLFFITSEAGTFEEYAQTVIQAALDYHRTYGSDLVMVTLVPTGELADTPLRYAHGYYAPDGLGARGLSGAHPDFRAVWRVLAAGRRLSKREIAVAEAWKRYGSEFMSVDSGSSVAVDEESLRERLVEVLDLPYEETALPRLELALYMETADR
jgi:hypothetical protein